MHWSGSPLLQSIVFVRRTLARRKKPSQNGLIAKPLTSPTPCLAVERGLEALLYPHRKVLTCNEASVNVLHFGSSGHRISAASLALRRAVLRFAFFAVWAVDVHRPGVVDICAERALYGIGTNAVFIGRSRSATRAGLQLQISLVSAQSAVQIQMSPQPNCTCLSAGRFFCL